MNFANPAQMENLFRNINLEISRLYFCLEINNQRIYELHSDWSIHPSEKILELTDLKRKNSFMKKDIQRLKDKKITLSCG